MSFHRSAWILPLLVPVLLASCNGNAAPDLPSATPLNTETKVNIPTPTLTSLPTLTYTPTLTFTPTLSPTPTWAVHGPGKFACPILLYHHIGVSESQAASTYYVTPEEFVTEMKALKEWGYVSISITQLTEAITRGAPLPDHPVVISFDDGNLDVFTNAFPIMQEFGFTGVIYIVTNYLHEDGYLGVEQVKEMVAAGWEAGSHSTSHPHLTYNHSVLAYEIAQSRTELQETLGIPVMSFAYPFGETDPIIYQEVHEAGYTSAVGLGSSSNQGLHNLFYLNRRPVPAGIDLATFASYLPWPGILEPEQTATRTP